MKKELVLGPDFLEQLANAKSDEHKEARIPAPSALAKIGLEFAEREKSMREAALTMSMRAFLDEGERIRAGKLLGQLAGIPKIPSSVFERAGMAPAVESIAKVLAGDEPSLSTRVAEMMPPRLDLSSTRPDAFILDQLRANGGTFEIEGPDFAGAFRDNFEANNEFFRAERKAAAKKEAREKHLVGLVEEQLRVIEAQRTENDALATEARRARQLMTGVTVVGILIGFFGLLAVI